MVLASRIGDDLAGDVQRAKVRTYLMRPCAE